MDLVTVREAPHATHSVRSPSAADRRDNAGAGETAVSKRTGDWDPTQRVSGVCGGSGSGGGVGGAEIGHG